MQFGEQTMPDRTSLIQKLEIKKTEQILIYLAGLTVAEIAKTAGRRG